MRRLLRGLLYQRKDPPEYDAGMTDLELLIIVILQSLQNYIIAIEFAMDR